PRPWSPPAPGRVTVHGELHDHFGRSGTNSLHRPRAPRRNTLASTHAPTGAEPTQETARWPTRSIHAERPLNASAANFTTCTPNRPAPALSEGPAETPPAQSPTPTPWSSDPPVRSHTT